MSQQDRLSVWALLRNNHDEYASTPDLVSIYHSAIGAMLAATDLDGTWYLEDEGTDDECWTADIRGGGVWFAVEYEVQP